ncbi:MAG TPA: hypothetical protein VF615_28540 [Longimicrobiaceae bacterium]|jgi:uncharacterized protein YacL
MTACLFVSLVPLVDRVVGWVQYQVRTMDDSTFMLAVGGLVLVLLVAMLGIRPRY